MIETWVVLDDSRLTAVEGGKTGPGPKSSPGVGLELEGGNLIQGGGGPLGRKVPPAMSLEP